MMCVSAYHSNLHVAHNSQSLQTEFTLGRAIADNPYHVPLVRAQLTRNIGSLFPEIREELSVAFTEAIPTPDTGEIILAYSLF